MKHNPKVLSFSAMLILTSFLAAQKAAAADTTPDPFAFTAQNGVPTSMVIGSNYITVAGIDTPTPISITGGVYSINRGAYTSNPGTVVNGDLVAVRVTSASTYSTTTTATLNIGGVTSDFVVVTDPIDLAPDQFVFAPVFNAVAGQVYESNPITVTGIAGLTPIGVFSSGGSGGGEYSINGGAYTSTRGAVKNGDVVRVRMTAPADPNVLAYTNLSIHYIYSDFFVQTAGTTPATPFTFTDQTDVPLSTDVVSSPITIKGLTGQGVISVTGGAYSVNGGIYRIDPTNILNNDVITVKQTSASTPGTKTTATLTISGTSSDFNVTTATAGTTDTTPDQFTFAPQTGVALGTQVNSNPITITGIDAPSPISITGGEYSLDDGATFTTADGTISNLQTVVVRQTASALPGTTTTATLTIGGVTGDFAVTTVANGDTTPDPFNFTALTGVTLGAQVTSEPITVAGIDAPSPISITGGEYSTDGGTTFVSTAGTVTNGQTVVVRQTASNLPLTTTTATLTIGGVTGDFAVTTMNADIVPDAFTFSPLTGVALSTQVQSSPITVSGIDAPSPISITGGEYSTDGGTTFTAADGTVTNGQTVVVRQTSSALPLTTSTATLTIGGVTGDFAVTTMDADITPDQFTFTALIDVALNSVIQSNPVTITGINAPSPITVINGEYSIDGAAFTSIAGTVTNGQTVIVRQTSASSFLTPKVATLVVGGVSSDFSVTTLAEVPVAPIIEAIPDQNAILNQLFTFTVKASDANGDKITFSLGSNAPAGVSIDPSTGALSWTPTALGTFTFDVIASDGTLSSTQPMTIIVTETPIVISSGGGHRDDGDDCDAKCERYHEYRRKYKAPEFKQQYLDLKALEESNPAEFARLEAIYMQYKKLSSNEISQLPEKVQADFKLFKHYNGYKHYRHLKKDLHR